MTGLYPARLGWADTARGAAIVFVVWGHVVAGLLAAGLVDPAGPLAVLNRFVYRFHMPAFLVLAGLFAVRGAGRPAAEFWGSRARTVVYPYLLWGALQTAVLVAAGGAANTRAGWGDLLRLGYDPPMQFWFLYVLLLASAGLRLVAHDLRLGLWCWAGVAGMLSAGLLAAGVPGDALPGRLAAALPAFVAGNLLAGRADRLVRLGRPALPAVAAVGFGAVVASLMVESLPVAVGILVGLCGAAGTVALAAVISDTRVGRGFAVVGRRSLEIYLAHVIAYAGTRVALLKVLGVTDLATHLALGTGLGVGGPLALAVAADALRLPLFRLPARGGR